MPTVRDFLGFVVNPPPGDPTRTAGSDLLPKGAAVQPAGTAAGLVPVTDGAGGFTWAPSGAAAFAARAYNAAGLGLNNGATAIPLSTVAFDTGGIVSAGVMTVPQAGKYVVLAEAVVTGSLTVGAYGLFVQVNGLLGYNGSLITPPAAPYNVGLTLGVVLNLNAGDILSLNATSTVTSAAIATSTGSTNFLSIAWQGS